MNRDKYVNSDAEELLKELDKIQGQGQALQQRFQLLP